jgi:hypothetical protein
MKQENIEKVLTGAIGDAQQEKGVNASQEIDLDWMTRFIEGAGFVSNQQLQKIWSKILVRQATKEATGVSIMALDCLRLLDAELAGFFLKAASLLTYLTILSDSNLDDVIENRPMVERTHLDRLEELGLLQYRDKESLFLLAGNAFCVLDKGCFEAASPPPRFFTLSIRGFELASALIKEYDIDCGDSRIALEYFSSEQIRAEISKLFSSSLDSPGRGLIVDISLDVPNGPQIELNGILKYNSGGDAIFRANCAKPSDLSSADSIFKEFLLRQIEWAPQKIK